MSYDKELSLAGKIRTQVPEMVQLPNGSFITVCREKVVKMPRSSKTNIAPAKTKTTRQRVAKGQLTKKEQAVKLYQANLGIPQTNMVELFMEALQMSKAGATTYVYNCKRELNQA